MRLFVAALGNNSVEVIDLRAGKPIHSIGGVQKPRGVWYVGGLKKLFVAGIEPAQIWTYEVQD